MQLIIYVLIRVRVNYVAKGTPGIIHTVLYFDAHIDDHIAGSSRKSCPLKHEEIMTW